MLNWTKNDPSSISFTGKDAEGNPVLTATVTNSAGNCSLQITRLADQANMGIVGIPGDYTEAKALFTALGQGL